MRIEYQKKIQAGWDGTKCEMWYCTLAWLYIWYVWISSASINLTGQQCVNSEQTHTHIPHHLFIRSKNRISFNSLLVICTSVYGLLASNDASTLKLDALIVLALQVVWFLSHFLFLQFSHIYTIEAITSLANAFSNAFFFLMLKWMLSLRECVLLLLFLFRLLFINRGIQRF